MGKFDLVRRIRGDIGKGVTKKSSFALKDGSALPRVGSIAGMPMSPSIQGSGHRRPGARRWEAKKEGAHEGG